MIFYEVNYHEKMDMVIKMKFNYGQRIKELREKENVTQKDLAQAIGLNRSSINQFENQYDIIPIKRLNQIANYFNVSIDYLFGLTNLKQYKNNNLEINFNLSSKRLKEWRKSQKLTQQKLGEKLNASSFVIIHHENGRTILNTPFLYELCKKYHLSADYLLGKIDEPQELSRF